MPDTPAALPKYYTWREVLDLYHGDEDLFLDAYCDGTLPLDVRREVERTMDPAILQCWLLRRVVRLLNTEAVQGRGPE